jgi:hercynylcysteine S-oxide lyase
VQYLVDMIPGFKIRKIQLDYPVTDNEILERTEKALQTDRSIKLVLMDAISSLPGVRVPWERLCHICRQYQVYSLVDAAHAVTQIPVNISEANPDFFVSNLHKWSYVPRGCAVLYVQRELQPLVHSLPIGHGYVSTSQPFIQSPISTNPEGQWVTEHEWIGTIDWSNYLSVDAAFHFIERCGGPEKIRGYCHNLAVEGGNRMAEVLGTEVLRCGGAAYIANMVNVRLPLKVPNIRSKTHAEVIVQRNAMLEELFARDCFISPYVMTRRGRKEWWCRVSAQIYLDLEDFEKGALILKEICEKLNGVDFSKNVQLEKEKVLSAELKASL